MCKKKRKRSGCASKGAAPIQSYPDYSSIVQPLLYTQPLNIDRKGCTKIFFLKMSSNNKARSINTLQRTITGSDFAHSKRIL